MGASEVGTDSPIPPSNCPTNGRTKLDGHNATMSLLAASRRTAAAGLSRALAANRGVLVAADGASRSVVTMGRTEDTILPVSFPPGFLWSAEAHATLSSEAWPVLCFLEDMRALLFLYALLTLLLISIFHADTLRVGGAV